MSAQDSLDQGGLDASLDLSEKAFKLASEQNDKQLILNSARQLAELYYYASLIDECQDVARIGLQLSIELADDEKEAFLSKLLGLISERTGNYAEAIQHFENALNLYTYFKDSVEIIKISINAAPSYSEVGDFSTSVEYLQRAIKISLAIGDSIRLGDAYINLGGSYLDIGDYEKAFEYYLKSKDIFSRNGRADKEANALFNIGLVHQEMEEYDKALGYYGEAGDIALSEDMWDLEAFIYQNMGNLYGELGNQEASIRYQRKAYDIFRDLSMAASVSDALLNIGVQYMQMNRYDSSEYYLQRCLEKSIENDTTDVYSDVNIELGKLYLKLKNYSGSGYYLNEALMSSRELGNIYLQSQTLKAQYELFKALSRPARALEKHEDYLVLRDSIGKQEQQQEVFRLSRKYNLEKLEIEVAKLNTENKLRVSEVERAEAKNRLFLFGLIFLSVIIAGLIFLFNLIRKKNKIIDHEKEKSEALLRNILPEETAEELKLKGSVEAKRYDNATILFTDFVSFTSYAEGVTPEDVVRSIDYFFRQFDAIVERYDIEKIKTIGDAYMCAGGVTKSDSESIVRIIKAAKEFLDFVRRVREDQPESIHPFEIRIGLNTGPIVAGVVGTHKFQFDIWGDAVNIAARMESACEPGRINVSESTHQLVKDEFEFEYRGELLIKNKGMMKMYYLKV